MIRKKNSILVLAAKSLDGLERKGADAEDAQCQTLTEAKRRARYFLTEEYMRASETTERLGYSQVLVNGKCEADYFAKPEGRPVKRRTRTNRELAMESLSRALREVASASASAYCGGIPAWVLRELHAVREKLCALRMAVEESK